MPSLVARNNHLIAGSGLVDLFRGQTALNPWQTGDHPLDRKRLDGGIVPPLFEGEVHAVGADGEKRKMR